MDKPKQPAKDFALPQIPDGDAIPPAFHATNARKPNLWQRYTQWATAHKAINITVIACIVLLITAGAVVVYVMLKPKPVAQAQSTTSKSQAPAAAPTTQKFYSPLTGMPVANQDATHRSVTGIMIENSESARPQSGLNAAGVVFEAIAEGGITRFAALYQDTAPQLIGPVRSVRPYYLDWMAAFDATIVHVGGSAKALGEVRSGAFKDADEFFNGGYFWRATDRVAPHNVYTSFQNLDKLNADKGYVSSTFTGWPRKDDDPPTAPNAASIDINISSAYYNVHYDFDKGCNCYDRYEGGAKQLDRETGQNAKPKVVIAMKVPTTVVLEDGYRESMATIGSGTVYVFQDGTVTVGTWNKASQKDQLVFKDDHGNVIKLNRGQTWVTATPTEESVTWQ